MATAAPSHHILCVAVGRYVVGRGCERGLLEDAAELLLGGVDARLVLALDEEVQLALAWRRVAAGRVVSPLGDDRTLGPLLDCVDRVAVRHLVARVLRVIVDVELGLEAHGRLHRLQRLGLLGLLLTLHAEARLLRLGCCCLQRLPSRLGQRCEARVERRWRGRGRGLCGGGARGGRCLGEERLLHTHRLLARPFGVAELQLQVARRLRGRRSDRGRRLCGRALRLHHALVVLVIVLVALALHAGRRPLAPPDLLLRPLLLGDRLGVDGDAATRLEARRAEILGGELPGLSLRVIGVGHAHHIVRRLLTGCLHRLDQVGRVLLLLGSDERVRDARVAGTAGAPDAMHIVLVVVGHLVVDDEDEVLDVKTSSRDGGGDQQRDVAALEVGDG
mmetsp:Transcript_27566/g.64335  ORF Transcript_27566/g.64335 Transcript_27566/m.64335 type:complete len:390 (+) Transcript_27566:771-1940(+)